MICVSNEYNLLLVFPNQNREALFAHKESLAQAMEEADHRQKKILVEMDDQREIFRNEMIKLEDNHNETLRK